MDPVTAVTAAVLVVIFGAVGVAKVFALRPMRRAAAHLGFGVAAYRRIGVLELAGAAGVAAGLAWRPIGLAAAAGLVLLLAGGAISHRRAGDPPVSLLLPAGTSILVLGYALLLLLREGTG